MTSTHGKTDANWQAWLMGAGLGLAAVTFLVKWGNFGNLLLPEFFFSEQDLGVLCGLSLFIGGTGLLYPRLTLTLPAAGWRTVVVIAALAFAASLLGHELLFGGFAITRDEAMALFDAQIFRSGRLVARVPEDWRALVSALQPEFRLPIVGNEAWVSAYLPGNAALHAAFGRLTSPLLAGASLLLVHAIARRLWPTRNDVALVAVLCLALSPQFLVIGMTPYAAHAHLALDLLWLYLFLRKTPLAHAGALAIGFVATGLHQIAFHPLFVAPFVLELWLRREFRLAALYTVAYGLIGLFWISWLWIMLGSQGLKLAPTGISILDAIALLYRNFAWSGLDLTAKNVLRFFGWGFPLLLPFLALGIAGWRQLDSTLRALVAGIMLTTLMIFVMLPYQGHGWGFRYWHGLYGSFALIAATGYARLPRAGVLVLAGIVASACVLIPLRLVQVQEFITPQVAAMRALSKVDTWAVVVDRIGLSFANDLVRNDPDLTSRPMMLDLVQMSEESLRKLCARGPVTLFDARDGAHFGYLPYGGHEPFLAQEQRLRAILEELNCGRRLTYD